MLGVRFVLSLLCVCLAATPSFADGDDDHVHYDDHWEQPFHSHSPTGSSTRSVPERNDIAEVIDTFGFTAHDSLVLRDALLQLDARRISPILRARLAPAEMAKSYRADNPEALPRKLLPSWYHFLLQNENARQGSIGVFYLLDSTVSQASAHAFPGEANAIMRRFHESLQERLKSPPSHWTPREENRIVDLFLSNRIRAENLGDRLLTFARFAPQNARWPELVKHFLSSDDVYRWRLVLDAVTWHQMNSAPVLAVLSELAQSPDELRNRMVAHAVHLLTRAPCPWETLE